MNKISIAERAATLLLQYGFTFNEQENVYDYEIHLQGYTGVYSFKAEQLDGMKYFNADEFITNISGQIHFYTKKMTAYLSKFNSSGQLDEILKKLYDLGFIYVKDRGEYHYTMYKRDKVAGFALHWENVADLANTDIDKWFEGIQASMLGYIKDQIQAEEAAIHE